MKFRSMADTRYQSSDSSHSEAADVRIFPTSFAQQRLWFLEQLDPGGTHYNISMVRRLIGPLDVAALEKAIHDIIRRHAILRTHFEKQDGQPVQVLSRIDLPPLMFVDLTGLRPQERTATMEVILREDARRPHDLGRAPLLRSKLLRLAEQEHVLLLDMHHIVSDG